jgi:oligosaccharide repeat unit polymerase
MSDSQIASAPTEIWPVRHDSIIVRGVLQSRRSLPLFCNPVFLFAFNWVLMLSSLGAQVTYVTYPFMGMPLLLCGFSFASFLFGYVVSRVVFHRDVSLDHPRFYKLNVTRMWNLNLLFLSAALLIIAFNWISSGPPPALSDPATYLSYGRFKQVLFPLLVTITVNATLDTSRWRKAFFGLFGIAALILYVSRGLLMVALLQAFFVFAIRTNMSRKRLYALAFGFLAFVVIAVTVIGNLRTAQSVFLEYLQIRYQYISWPMAYLWVTSYISIPFSNLCWLFATSNFHGPTLGFLYPLLPAFFAPPDPHPALHSDVRIIDGANTYLAAYALDFSYLGVYLANLALGLGCGWFVERSLPRHILVAGIFLTCLSFLFFTDMFVPLSTIIQFAIQSAVQRRCIKWTDAQKVSAVLA